MNPLAITNLRPVEGGMRKRAGVSDSQPQSAASFITQHSSLPKNQDEPGADEERLQRVHAQAREEL